MTGIKAINDFCLRLLARREHSRNELLTKCLAKGYGKDESLAVIDGLAGQGWQDDLRYAQSYARHRIQRGYGPVFINYQLQQKGVDLPDLEGIVETVADNWMDVLEQVYSKKYKAGFPNERVDRQEWAKRSRFLMQRGFPPAMISALYNHLNSNNFNN